MKEDNFLQFLKKTQDNLVQLTVSKGREYKGAGDDQFGNFHRLAKDTGLTREQVLLVYLTKHFDSIRTWVRDEASGVSRERSESIGGRIEDAILYLTILGAMASERDNQVKLPDSWPQLIEPSTNHWLDKDEQKKDAKPVGPAEFLWDKTSVYLAYDPAKPDPNKVRLVRERVESVAGVRPKATHLHHPDALHGCDFTTAIIWVGSEGEESVVFNEFSAKCKERRIAFIPEWLLFSMGQG